MLVVGVGTLVVGGLQEHERADAAAGERPGERRRWERETLSPFLEKAGERQEAFRTISGLEVDRLYAPSDVDLDYGEDLGYPGEPPFTRGVYPTMYRGRHWTMRQIAGFGTAADTNRRFHYLMAQGQTGLSVDFDMPTLMGYDSDHPMSEGEVGREGVAIDTLADMEALFDRIDLEKISVSMTINPSAWILFAMYIAVAEKNGFDPAKLSGTIQNDILKEYMAQKEWIYPVRPSLRIVRDCITYSAEHLPRYNPLNISGYHISEAGAVATQEVAYTMASTIQYVQDAVDAGVDVDDFAPRLSFFFVSQADFFEEIAKFRAARRVYARIMRERFGARKPESCRLRFHAQTAAATLTKPQPKVNIVRTAFQALSAVLGGTQSLHTNGLDEAYAIPTEEAMKIALRTQQVIAHETGVADVIDGMGGSWYVEDLTTRIEEEVWRILDEVEEQGGTIACIDDGYFQRGIGDSAYDYAIRKASGDRHQRLKRMLPYWRKLSTKLRDVSTQITGLEERAGKIDAHMERYENIRAGDDATVRTLSSSSLTQFLIAGLVLVIAVFGAIINFHLIALPMSEMVGGNSYIGPMQTADVAALVIIMVEITMGLFLMESLRITRLFPVVGALDDRKRHALAWTAFTFLFALAGVEAALAYMRDMLAADQQALVEMLSSAGAAEGAAAAGGEGEAALRWIPAVGQMLLGFILPFALTFVAIPLESFMHAARTVLGVLAVGLMRALATLLRVGAAGSRGLSRVLVQAYDVAIFLPLAGERLVRGAREARSRAAARPEEV